MVGVKVGDDQARHRAVEPVEDRRPAFAHRFVGEPGIDYGPSGAVPEQPEVDVIELERQRHAQPEDAGRHFGQFAGGRRMGVGKMQGHGRFLIGGRTSYHTVAN
jgi:hypothetical protein